MSASSLQQGAGDIHQPSLHSSSDTLLDSAAVFAAYARASGETRVGKDSLIWADSAIHYYNWREDDYIEHHYLVALHLLERAHHELLYGEDIDTPNRAAAALKQIREPLTGDIRVALQRAWAMTGQAAANPGEVGRVKSEIDGRRPPTMIVIPAVPEPFDTTVAQP